MLREELLRSKQDEIARCLLSRKRKLSELYFATVGYAGATETFADSAYREKEQAFLDANDITKGRYFNEATLPALRSYAVPPVRETKVASLPVPATTPASPNVAPAPPLPQAEAHASEAASQGASDAETERVTAPHPVEKQPSDSDRQSSDSRARPQLAPGTTGTSQKSDGPAPEVRHAAQNLQHGQKATSSLPDTPRSSQDSSDATIRADQKDATKAISSAQPSISTPKPQHDLPASPLPGRPVHVAEQPLSPVSSAGPYSNNTPAPTAASPATSTTEEVSAEKLPTPKRIAATQERSSFVPTTPDEQLRFEEAQSLQQNTLLVSQVKDGAGAGPLTNQVISEDLPSTSTTANVAEGASEQVSKNLLPEPKVPESTPAAVVEPRSQSQSPLGQASSQAETVVKDVAPGTQPTKKSSSPPHPGPPPERMTTRVSSGAIRHKSVSEILGEAPKTPVSPIEKPHTVERPPDSARDGVYDSTDSAKLRLKDRRAREKERNKFSTVVFPKQQQQQPDKDGDMDIVRQQSGDLIKLNEERDYLFTLFQNKAYAPPRGTALTALLSSAHKTLTTNNYLLDYQEQMDCRILRRIYDLQHANRWPLRQLKRSAEPPRQAAHWDVLLDHMKWMRTDFREERKWKLAAAKSCADWCAEYIHSDPESRSMLRVQAKIPPKEAPCMNGPQSTTMVSPPAELGNDAMEISHPTPDLVPSSEEDSVSEGFPDEPRHGLQDTVAPAAIFSLGTDEFTFSLDMTPTAQKLLDELPIYTPVQIAPDTNLPGFKDLPDASWKTEILPVSKYARGKIMFREDEPARKRSRYDYSQYSSGSEHPVVELPPEQTNVALFQPENRHIRDRIHPAQPFRPPTEYPMPSLGFLESRQSSQWTYAEDEELRSLVEEYSYNWSLISSCLTPSSQFTSGAERRTPWECFERWAGIEGLPSDMSKTAYFRAYHQRIDTAQRNVMAQQAAAQQQQQQQQGSNGNNQPPVPLIRRRGTQPIRVDRRRSSKHLALLDAMRKLAKKRETILQKQQHASQLASLRKVNEANQPKPPISSPAEFSRLKHERELKLQERQEQYRQQMIAQQRASLAARAGQMPNQQQMMNAPGRAPNAIPHNPNAPPVSTSTANGLPNGISNPLANGMPNGLPQNVGVNQARPHVQGMHGSGGPVNNHMSPNPMAMKMMPQASMQQNNGPRSNMAMQASPDNARVIREANRLQEQQRILQSRQQPSQHPLQQQQPPQAQNQQQQLPQQPQQPQQQFHAQPQFVPQGSNSPNLNMPTVNGTPNNPAMIAALQAGGGMQSPPFHNSAPQGVSTPSPRMGQPNTLSSGAVPTTISTIQSQIQRSNPNMPLEQVKQLTTERLHQYQQQQQQRMSQVAMNAAAGNLGVQPNYQVSHDGNFQPQSGMNGGPNMQVHQAQGFSPMMRVPQPSQQTRVGAGGSPAMGVAAPQQSRSATPQTQRSGSIQTGTIAGASKSPNTHSQTQSMGT
ncbi:MYB and HSA domain protein [Aspergillus foveolatus]|uniref:MYB and HSA domain protein n=1 Tax=Aspergillus foveolatus TaxID=210207 RepID=UPI003CCCEBD1